MKRVREKVTNSFQADNDTKRVSNLLKFFRFKALERIGKESIVTKRVAHGEILVHNSYFLPVRQFLTSTRLAYSEQLLTIRLFNHMGRARAQGRTADGLTVSQNTRGNNLAGFVAVVEDGAGKTKTVTRIRQNDKTTGLHAEELLEADQAALIAEHGANKVRIISLISEREPCSGLCQPAIRRMELNQAGSEIGVGYLTKYSRDGAANARNVSTIYRNELGREIPFE